jgi:TraM recognition site of TraD and TraG
MEGLIILTLVAVGLLLIFVAAKGGAKSQPSAESTDDIILGTIEPSVPVVGLPRMKLNPEDQRLHATIWGTTGSGKSRLLESLFLQHLNHGHGVGLMEPHFDLSFDTLSFLVTKGFFNDPEAFKRLVYIDWGNGAYVPFNVLAPVSGNSDPATVARLVLDAMLRVWPELAEAPLFQTLFLSSIRVLMANDLPITFLYQVLVDPQFRNSCLAKVSDPLIHQTFDWFDQLGRDQAQAAGSTIRRAFLLSFSPYTRLTLGQPDNWLNFRQIMDEGKASIINLGNVSDPEARLLIGAMLLVRIEQAALSRADSLPSQRVPFTLLVDEWPSFAAQEKTISHILSQCRKYNLRMYLSAQSLSQVGSARLTGALENCKLNIAFGLGRESAEIQAKHIGKADPFAVKEAALTETQHTQYLSISEQFETWTEELQSLDTRLAYVKLHNKEPVKIRTLTVPSDPADQHELDRVLLTYRTMYQRNEAEAEHLIAALGAPSTPPFSVNGAGSSGPAYKRAFNKPNDP